MKTTLHSWDSFKLNQIYNNYDVVKQLIRFNFIVKNFQVEITSLPRYVSPVNPAVFPHLTLVLLGIGVFFTTWFFVYEVTTSKQSRSLKKEIAVSIVASLFSGFGILFLLLSVGIYV
ncbi:transmembrane protein 258 [Coccinella septempunctata]|uniref:transmembrane protein 258 n=1 Tax=Coccinella septempunctata TaxID=41139 RepID=UPI001D0683E7|nr:transmembrane protein 258 [Coccinella septempunctata]